MWLQMTILYVFTAEYYSVVCTVPSLCTRSSFDVYLGCFRIFTLIKLQKIWGCVYLFQLVFLFSWGRSPELQLLGHTVVLFLVFQGHTGLVSIMAAPVYIPSSSARVPSSPPLLQHLWFLLKLLLNVLEWHWWIRSRRFRVSMSMIHDLYIALCARHPKSNHLPSPYMCPPIPHADCLYPLGH